MPDIPSTLRAWNVTAGANNPNTNTIVGSGLSGNLQQIQATVRQYLASIGSSVIASGTIDLSTVDGFTIPISGNATVTSFGSEQAGIPYRLQFSGTPTLKQSTAIQTPGSADMSIVAGDIVDVHSLGSGNWKVAHWLTPNPKYFGTLSGTTLSASGTVAGSVVTASKVDAGSGTLTVAGSALAITPSVTFAGSTIAQNSQSTAYTTVAADANKHLLHPAADNNPRTFTIDSNANVPYAVGTAITFANEINTVTIAITSDTLTFALDNTTGSRTLVAGGIATAIKITSTKWIISGMGLT